MIQAFQNIGIERGGIIFFPDDAALQIIDELERTETELLGVDAFRLTDYTTQPLMEYSLDLSYTSQQGSWELARNHVSALKGKGLLFELVLNENS